MAPVGTELPMSIVLGVSQSPGARGRGLGRPHHSVHADLAQESQPLAAQRRSMVGREEERHPCSFQSLKQKTKRNMEVEGGVCSEDEKTQVGLDSSKHRSQLPWALIRGYGAM